MKSHIVIKQIKDEIKMYFLPKKDLVYKIVIWSLPIIMLPLLFIVFSTAMIIVLVLSLVLSVWLWNSTSYRIENGELYIKCWVFKKKVNIQNIIKVRKTNNILSSYALSLERLEITEKPRNKFYVSPDNFDLFIDELKKSNPNIEII